MKHDVNFDSGIIEIIESLNKLFNELDATYNELDKKIDCLSGDPLIWQSEPQRVLYSHLVSVKNKFPNRVEDFRVYEDFLRKQIENYNNIDDTNNISQDNNREDLDINEHGEV